MKIFKMTCPSNNPRCNGIFCLGSPGECSTKKFIKNLRNEKSENESESDQLLKYLSNQYLFRERCNLDNLESNPSFSSSYRKKLSNYLNNIYSHTSDIKFYLNIENYVNDYRLHRNGSYTPIDSIKGIDRTSKFNYKGPDKSKYSIN